MKKIVLDAYDPETFRARAHQAVDLLADHLAQVSRDTDVPVLPWLAPEASRAAWPAHFETPHEDELAALLRRVVDASIHLHSPRFVGHQVSAPLPIAALTEMVGALLNNGMAVYEMGPVSSGMERSLARWMADKVGFGSDGDAIMTSGGSAGNLTALLAARQKHAGFDAWTLGNSGGPPLSVLASAESHYSVQRATQIMGWGKDGVEPVPVDARFRMRVDALDDAKRAAEARGRKVCAVVASAGSTSTGAFDPLPEIADFCEEHGLWLHVDGAHGASCVLSRKHRERVRGIERADSVVWDAHKMMMMPALVTAVVFKDGRDSYGAFAQHASYLFEKERGATDAYQGALRTLECTKRMMSATLWLALRVHGEETFSSFVDGMIDLAQGFAARLASLDDFEVAVPPECNIVCFRHVPERLGGPAAASREALDGLQARIRARINESGAFYMVQTTLPTGVHLRTTLINPRTTDADLDALVDAVRAAAAS